MATKNLPNPPKQENAGTAFKGVSLDKNNNATVNPQETARDKTTQINSEGEKLFAARVLYDEKVKEKVNDHKERISKLIESAKVELKDQPKVELKDQQNVNLQKEINCIKYSIKKLELNMKLANQDKIEDTELDNLLKDISTLHIECKGSKIVEGKIQIEESVALQNFMEEIIQKRDMNNISYLIKIVSFLIPIYAFSCRALLKGGATVIKAVESEKITTLTTLTTTTTSMVSNLFSNIANRLSIEDITIDDVGGAVDFIGKGQEANINEGIISFLGVGNNEDVDIKTLINGSITSSANKISATFHAYATKYQRLILYVFIVLLSIETLLRFNNNDAAKNIEDNFTAHISNAINTTTTLLLNGGKKSRQRKQQVPKKDAKPTKPTKPTKPAKTPKAAPKKKK